MQRFILLSTIRSGTNFFNSVLNSHPDIHIYSESLFYDFDFNPEREDNFYVNWLERVRNDPAQILNRNMIKFAFEFIRDKYSAKKHMAAVGMDIKYDFWDRLFFIQQYFLSRKPRVIHLVRLNTLRQQISAFLMHCRNFGIERGPAKPIEYKGLIKVGDRQVAVVICQEFLSALSALEARKQRFSQLAGQAFDCLEISYEELLGGSDGNATGFAPQAFEKIMDFLKIKNRDVELETTRKKVNPSSIKDLIANHEEVTPYFQECGLGHYVN